MKKRIISLIMTGAVAFVGFAPGSLAASNKYDLLKQGDKDQLVYKLQEKLGEKGYLQTNPTGYFGTVTDDALKSYQKDVSLSADGKAGQVTRKLLMGEKYENIGNAMNKEMDMSQVLKPGMDSLSVGLLQRRLMELQYFDGEETTSHYGPVTEQAVRLFQRANKLEIDGVAGQGTMALMFSGEAKKYTIYPGDSGDDIKRLQNRLTELKYYNATVDGEYGSSTKSAVEAFQNRNGLNVDGIAGTGTRELLYSPDARVAKGEKLETSGEDKSSDDKASDDKKTDEKDSDKKTDEKSDNKTEDKVDELKNDEKKSEDKKSDEKKSDDKKSDEKKSDEKKSDDEDKEVSSKGDKSKVSDMIAFAKKQLGKRYVWSNEGPNSFDCSGFVYYVLTHNGVKTSRYSAAGFSQVKQWDKITSKKDLKPGDILFFRAIGGSRIGHTGIWLGDNKFIHASSSKGKVVITSVGSYFNKNFSSARRVF